MSEYKTEEYQHGIRDNEINIIDLIVLLLKRKNLILIVFMFFLILGVLFSFLKTQKYEYITTLQIGTILNEDEQRVNVRLIEPLETVLVKINNVYIPDAIAIFFEKLGHKLKVQAKIQEKSNVILLKSIGSSVELDLYKKFHRSIITPLTIDHKKRIETLKERYKLDLDTAVLSLTKLEDVKIYGLEEKILQGKIKKAMADLNLNEDQKTLLENQAKRLNETKKLLRIQIQMIEMSLELSYANRPKASKEIGDEAKALTFLMINNQINQNEIRLASLKERLIVGLEHEKQKLENQLSENRRRWGLQKDKISELESELIKMRAHREIQKGIRKNAIGNAQNKLELHQNTRSLNIAALSVGPVGTSKKMILAISIIIGLFGGIISAFLAEFITYLRKIDL